MVYFKLNELLEKRNITKYRISKDTQIDINAITKICNNKSTQIKLSTLDVICNYLDCNIEELIEFKKG